MKKHTLCHVEKLGCKNNRKFSEKKYILFILFILASFSIYGCGPGYLFYEIYHETHDEISRQLEELFIDIMVDTGIDADTKSALPPLLKITAAQESAPLSVTDTSVILSYAHKTSSFIAKGILREKSHNYTKLPKNANVISTFTLWRHYDSGLAESDQPYACCFNLYEYKNQYYIKAEFNDARIEDSPYYLPLDDDESSYLLALSAGDLDSLLKISEREIDTGNDTLESYSVKESLRDIDYDGIASVSKHQK